MIVYHGTNLTVEKPKHGFSKKYLDFGEGFYVTIYEKQARKWAQRKAMRHGGTAVVNVYEFSDGLSGLKVLDFKADDEAWLEFICTCRRGQQDSGKYDIVIGNVADDDVFKSVDMYFKGIWDKNRTIEEIRYYKRNNQIALLNQRAIDETLAFLKAYEVKK